MMSFPDQNFYSHPSIHPTNNLTSTPNGGTSGQSLKPLQEGLVEDRVRVDRKLYERLVDGSVDNVEGNSPNGYSSDLSYSCSRSSISKTAFVRLTLLLPVLQATLHHLLQLLMGLVAMPTVVLVDH